MSKLYFRYAAMNAGKSTALLQAAHNYEERGMRVRLFTAAHDDRAGAGVIGSRLGLQRAVETFGPGTTFNAHWLGDGIACVLIDEAQFLTPDQVRQLHRLAHQRPIPFHLRIALDHAASEIVASRANHRQRRTQFVRDASHEFHLLLRQLLRASSGRDEGGNRDAH